MNIKKYYLYKIFYDLLPIYPIYLLMFQNKNLSIGQISLLLAIWSVPAVVLEIPTGILADRWNRRNMIFIGGILRAFCYLTWIFSNGFLLFAVGFVFWGIGGAFGSGSEEALVYDSLKIQNREDHFDRILGRGHFLSGISNILAALSGGFIGMKYGFRIALVLSVVFCLISAGVAMTMKEVNLYKDCLSEQKQHVKENTLGNALSFLFKSKEILLFVILTLLVITTAEVLDEYDQLIAKGYGLSIKMIGIWTAVRFILISIGGYIAYGLRIVVEKIIRVTNGMFSIGFLCMIAAVFLILSGLINWIGIMVLYGLYYLIMSAGGVIREDYIQQKIGLEGRSTVHSLIALSNNLYGILCYGLLGVIITRTNLQQGLVWCGIYILVCITVLEVVFKIVKRKL